VQLLEVFVVDHIVDRIRTAVEIDGSQVSHCPVHGLTVVKQATDLLQ
jgi:very-short-patch-repair endonuclease